MLAVTHGKLKGLAQLPLQDEGGEFGDEVAAAVGKQCTPKSVYSVSSCTLGLTIVYIEKPEAREDGFVLNSCDESSAKSRKQIHLWKRRWKSHSAGRILEHVRLQIVGGQSSNKQEHEHKNITELHHIFYHLCSSTA